MIVQLPIESVNSSSIDNYRVSLLEKPTIEPLNQTKKSNHSGKSNHQHANTNYTRPKFNHLNRTYQAKKTMADAVTSNSTVTLSASSSTTSSAATTSISNTNMSTGNSISGLTSTSSSEHQKNASSAGSSSASPAVLNIEEFGLSIGSIVALETCWNKKFEGEVMAFDYGNKILLLKCPASSGATTRHDVHLINLNFVLNLEKKQNNRKDLSSSIDLPDLKIKKAEERKSIAVNERKKLVSAFNQDVSQNGLRLFLHLTKTMGNSVTWSEKDILVNDNVCISHPYQKENCKVAARFANANDETQTKKNQGAVDYVKTLVERFWSEN